MAIDDSTPSSTPRRSGESAVAARQDRSGRRRATDVRVPAWLGSGADADPTAEPIFAALARRLEVASGPRKRG